MQILIAIGIALFAALGVCLLAIGVFLAPNEQAPGAVSGRRINRLAITSFVFSVLWLYAIGSLLGLILGVLAVRRIDSSGRRERGRGFAVAGIVLGALGLLLMVILVVLSDQAF